MGQNLFHQIFPPRFCFTPTVWFQSFPLCLLLLSSECELLLDKSRPNMFCNGQVRFPVYISIVVPSSRLSCSIEWKSSGHQEETGEDKEGEQESGHGGVWTETPHVLCVD